MLWPKSLSIFMFPTLPVAGHNILYFNFGDMRRLCERLSDRRKYTLNQNLNPRNNMFLLFYYFIMRTINDNVFTKFEQNLPQFDSRIQCAYFSCPTVPINNEQVITKNIATLQLIHVVI